ncbi:MAG TPA: hypothetical protein VHZ51_27190 [Ktedonobacteraceae bacterium]|nr:hypothetical protein [Ktedonobacteraceae bacterium]
MVTQAIERWLDKLFAWWPWKKQPASSYPQAVSNKVNRITPQEPVWRTSPTEIEGQPGITSIAVEHGKDETIAEAESDCLSVEHQDEAQTPYQPLVAEDITLPPLFLFDSSPPHEHSPREGSSPAIEKQRLVFLHYLVRKGLVNEGFATGQVPDQYNKDH